MHWIYLSPHLDDVALSLGGLLWEQSQSGEQVSIWTICAGDPPEGEFSPFAEALHARWETGAQSMPVRRAEDIKSCRLLGADYMHFSLPDCIYRRAPGSGKHLYASEEALWVPVHTDEDSLVAQTAARMTHFLPPDAQVVCPLTFGNHVDHRFTRNAAEMMGRPLTFYADYPYVLESENLKALGERPSIHIPLSSQALRAWQAAVAAHQSQISTFWGDLDEMRREIEAYSQWMDGIKLFN